MRNTIPEKVESLRVMAHAVAGGVVQYGDSLPLLKTTPAQMSAEIAAVVATLTIHRTATEELGARRATTRAAVVTVRKFLTDARDTFKGLLGHHHNQDWASTGLSGSLMIPRSEGPVLGLLGSFKEFLATHPQFEISARNITSERAGLLFTELSAARNAVNLQSTLVQKAALNRDARAAVLRKRISIVMAELRMHLTLVDPRWLAFGLNMPGAQQTPEAPQNVTAVVYENNRIHVEWPDVPRAKHYRVRMKVMDVDPEFLQIDSPSDPRLMIECAPANAKVQIVVSAVNSGGESAWSAIITVHSA